MVSAKSAPAKAISLETVAIDDLLPDPANPRRISDTESEALTRSLREFGFIQPVIARREDRTVIGGHQRLLETMHVVADALWMCQ